MQSRLTKKREGSLRTWLWMGVAAVAASPVAWALFATPALADDDKLDAADILMPNPAEFIPALIAFVVIWAVLAHFVWPSVIRTLDLREQTIQDNLDAAQKSKDDAAAAYKEAQAQIDAAHMEADDIIAEAKRQADASRAATLAQANKDAKRIADKARENIEIDKLNAKLELTNQAAGLAVDLAGKIIDKELDPATQRTLIEQALKEAENTHE